MNTLDIADYSEPIDFRPRHVLTSYSEYYYYRRFQLLQDFDFLHELEQYDLFYEFIMNWINLDLTTIGELEEEDLGIGNIIDNVCEELEESDDESDEESVSIEEPTIPYNSDYLSWKVLEFTESFEEECPVEQELTQCVKLKCGHSLGVNTLESMLKHIILTCPLCREPIETVGDIKGMLGWVGAWINSDWIAYSGFDECGNSQNEYTQFDDDDDYDAIEYQDNIDYDAISRFHDSYNRDIQIMV